MGVVHGGGGGGMDVQVRASRARAASASAPQPGGEGAARVHDRAGCVVGAMHTPGDDVFAQLRHAHTCPCAWPAA